jgi:hypothetical protein
MGFKKPETFPAELFLWKPKEESWEEVLWLLVFLS